VARFASRHHFADFCINNLVGNVGGGEYVVELIRRMGGMVSSATFLAPVPEGDVYQVGSRRNGFVE
jgi:hypothetical protein